MKNFVNSICIFLICIAFFSCSNQANNSSVSDSTVSTKFEADSLQKKAASAGFFYFELTPTASIPVYFSDVKLITYSNNTDLARQQDEYMQKLRDEATKDGYDQRNYNQKSSIEKSTFKDAEDERQSNIKSLRDAGQTVNERTLH